jgi:hypothetical protein
MNQPTEGIKAMNEQEVANEVISEFFHAVQPKLDELIKTNFPLLVALFTSARERHHLDDAAAERVYASLHDAAGDRFAAAARPDAPPARSEVLH